MTLGMNKYCCISVQWCHIAALSYNVGSPLYLEHKRQMKKSKRDNEYLPFGESRNIDGDLGSVLEGEALTSGDCGSEGVRGG